MRKFGLIGYPLTHSFSKSYFTEKFRKENISDCSYELFEIPAIEDFPQVLKNNPALKGINVTIPYKKAVIPYLSSLDESAKKAGAVNVIKVEPNGLIGYNSDYYGFLLTLEEFIKNNHFIKAIVLGNGGAASAVRACLNDLGISFKTVSRNAGDESISYQDLLLTDILKTNRLIINTTPVGMYPKVELRPDLPYHLLDDTYLLYDLVYNPLETEFLKSGKEKGAKTMNGLAMLHLQAEKAWEIWNF